MPKAMQYSKGSVIYFEGDHDERIFILQKGTVLLSSTDIETGQPVSTYVKSGEFFGVKSALGHFAREETASVASDTLAVLLTVQEFETMFSQNKVLIMKMLRVFSNQLRQIHGKIESILNNINEDQENGMLAVAKSFCDDEKYRSACDVYVKFLKRYPNSGKKNEVVTLFANAKKRAERAATRSSVMATEDTTVEKSSLPIFSLPAFERFKKTYAPEEVIIAEFEPGDSFYLIQSGTVQLVKCVSGVAKNLDILKPGEFFGEMAILDKSPRSATCMAVGRVECLEFNKENFEVLITGNPQIALILLKLFCKRINDQKRAFRVLVISDLQARLADVFLMLDEKNRSSTSNDPTNNKRRFNVTVSDVAHWAGLSIEVTRDEINKLIEKHKIDVYDNYIIVNNIVDMKRLYDMRSLVKNS